jgi:hypothetical protein
MKLTCQQYRQLQVALISAFPSRGDFEQMLRIRLNTKLNEISLGANMKEVVFQTIAWAENCEKIKALVEGARAENEGNPDLIVVESSLFATTSNGSAPKFTESSGFPLERIGGVVPLTSNFYIPRTYDEQFFNYLRRRDPTISIRGEHGTGKSSLFLRAKHTACQNGAKVAPIDFNFLDPDAFDSLKDFLIDLMSLVANELHLTVFPEDAWNNRLGSIQNLTNYLETHVLGAGSGHIVLLMDNTDRLLGKDYCGQLFGVFRSWHDKHAHGNDWSNLTLVLAHIAPDMAFVPKADQSPFNVATKIELKNFTDGEIAELNRRYGDPLRSEAELAAFIERNGRRPDNVRRELNRLVDVIPPSP